MELKKKKYKKAEVEEMVSQLESEYEAKIKELKSSFIGEVSENSKLKAKIFDFEQREKSISDAILNAQKTAEEILENAKLKASLERERLSAFVLKFNSYFDYLVEKYPYYPEVVKGRESFDRLKVILRIKDNDKSIEEADKIISDDNKKPRRKNNALPKDRIDDYVASTNSNGFNLEEVLNPGELKLEDLCKELGLIEN